MAPVQPRHANSGSDTVLAFDGAIQAKTLPHSTRTFMIEVQFDTQHPRLLEIMQEPDKKPPIHFHPYQYEYFEVIKGSLIVEIEGKERIITSADGEISIPPWANHRSYPAQPAEGNIGDNITKFLMSGSGTERNYPLDSVFFQNWYGYQDQIVLYDEKVDLIQVLSLFDAGGSCLTLPWYIPFRQTVSLYILNVLVGRWLGGLLGYQPFHKPWTNDWERACRRMQVSVFQKRFAVR